MVWTVGENSAICTPNNPSKTPCTASMLTFLNFLTLFLGHSNDGNLNRMTSFAKNVPYEEVDFVVVGAGGAGCVVANRLSEISNWKIVLLERGDEEPLIADVPGLITLMKGTDLDYDYVTQPEPNACSSQACSWTRGKVMGGSSTLYSMHFVRGNSWDYDNWAKLGNPGWTWKEVLPYFKKSEDFKVKEVLEKNPLFHNTGGYQTIESAGYYDENAKVILNGWKEVGLREVDYNSGDNLGTSRLQYATIRRARQSSNGAFIRPIRGKRPNLVVRPNSWVIKVIIDPRTKTATGVEYRLANTNNIKRVYAKKEVILSAGSIDTPKVLMLSGVGPSDNLKESGIEVLKDLPVGKNLHNHFSISPISVSTTNKTASFTIRTLHKDLVYWLINHHGPLSVTGFMDNIAFLNTSFEKELNVPDIQIGYIKYKYDDQTKSPRFLLPYCDGFLLKIVYLAPKSRGELKLDSSDPINKQPLIYPNYHCHPDDIKAVAEGARLTKRLVETQTFKEAGFVASRAAAPHCGHLEYETFEYYECLAKKHTGIVNHQVGTCKMGPKEDPDAVVDAKLKVYGIKNLRVIDASIMPVLTRGNTLAPTVMIAEKGSDMVKEDWLN